MILGRKMGKEPISVHDIRFLPRNILFLAVSASLILPDATLPSLSGVSSTGSRDAKTLRGILPSAARGIRLPMPKIGI